MCGDVPRIELFARQRTQGWDVWGNEVPDEETTEKNNYGEFFVNKILQGDCLDIMKDIDNDTFDIVVSSPPYNIGMNYNTYNDNQTDYVDWQVKVWNEVCRVLKPTEFIFKFFKLKQK